MTTHTKFKHLLVGALLTSVAATTAASAGDNKSNTAEATAAEAALSFWDLPALESAYITTEPALRDDAFPVGKLGMDGGKKDSIVALAKEIGDGKHGKYDSLLITHKGKLLFESYFNKGRINLAHGQASATKAYTAMILGRAMQLGYLTMADLDKPLVDFLGDLDRSKLVDGAEKITLHKALTMHGGINVTPEQRQQLERNPGEFTSEETAQLKGQGLVQTLLDLSGPITDETQIYKYGNFNPIMVMSVIDAVVPGSAEDFIKTEFLDRLGIKNYTWDANISGLPEAGWRVKMLSRDMLKFGSVILNGGKWQGEQFIPAEYMAKATSGLVKPTEDWMPDTYRYGYFFYQSPLTAGGKSYNTAFAWGGGGQRVIVIDDLDLTIIITGHDREDQIMAQIEKTVLPAFAE